MNLPNYFLADLPAEASVSPALVSEACQTLKRNREQYLANRSTKTLVELLAHLAKDWLNPDFSFRRFALAQGPPATGFSRPTLTAGLDDFFKHLTAESIHQLLEQDLGHPQRLDQFHARVPGIRTPGASIATAPELLVHIAAGNLPNPTVTSIALGLLARSAQFVKCATGTAFLPRLFAHSLYAADAKLGACLEIAEWRGGNAELEKVLFEQASRVTATGSDETLLEIRQRLPSKTRFLGFGTRLSFGYVAQEMLSGLLAHKIANLAAKDVVAWNQLGCLSPHVFYVQAGSSIAADQFAELLAAALAERESVEPRGDLPVDASAPIASRRAIYELRAAHSPDTRLWGSPGSTAWTVVYEADPRFQISCLNRFIYVKPVKDLTEALQSADAVRTKVSTVGMAVPEHKMQELATELARWGATRVCSIGQMQNPPLAWHHDGRPALADLVTWTDLEI